MAIKKASNRKYTITPAANGDILEIGPASTPAFVGTFVIQFNPDVLFVGEIVVLARLTGKAAEDAGLPFLPVPYRRVTVNNVASDYTFVDDAITGATKIQIPSSMDSIGLLVACSAGSCTVVCQDVQGPSV